MRKETRRLVIIEILVSKALGVMIASIFLYFVAAPLVNVNASSLHA